MKKIYITNSYKSLISINYYQTNKELHGMDSDLNLLSYESETNQSYLNNNENLSYSNIYLENSNEISTILKASEQNDANLFSSIENFQFPFPLTFNRITNMREMFSFCNSLISLPDISKWNTSNVYNMNGMFSFCNSLISLPDISKWDTSNVKNMVGMFSKCNSLISLPDISKWYTSNVKDISRMFTGCYSLISLPDLSKWNTFNVEDILNERFNCLNNI